MTATLSKVGENCQATNWRRVRDSNPRRAFGPYTLSRGAPSTTRPTLRIVRFACRVRGLRKYETGPGARAAIIRSELRKVKESSPGSLAVPEGTAGLPAS